MKAALTSDTHYGHNKKTHIVHEEWLTELAKDIKDNDVKVLIHAGDWTANKQDQFRRTLMMFRRYIDIPIAGVRGNHDLWQYKAYPRKAFYGKLNQTHIKWFKDANIHWLENGPLTVEDVLICGYDGWYNLASPPTNDQDQIVEYIEGVPAMIYLASQTYKKLDNLLQIDDTNHRKTIMVTHMPPYADDVEGLYYCANPKYLAPIKDKFDILCTGHSHQYVNRTENNCLLLNAGSDYNKPKHLIFDV